MHPMEKSRTNEKQYLKSHDNAAGYFRFSVFFLDNHYIYCLNFDKKDSIKMIEVGA